MYFPKDHFGYSNSEHANNNNINNNGNNIINNINNGNPSQNTQPHSHMALQSNTTDAQSDTLGSKTSLGQAIVPANSGISPMHHNNNNANNLQVVAKPVGPNRNSMGYNHHQGFFNHSLKPMSLVSNKNVEQQRNNISSPVSSIGPNLNPLQKRKIPHQPFMSSLNRGSGPTSGLTNPLPSIPATQTASSASLLSSSLAFSGSSSSTSLSSSAPFSSAFGASANGSQASGTPHGTLGVQIPPMPSQPASGLPTLSYPNIINNNIINNNNNNTNTGNVAEIQSDRGTNGTGLRITPAKLRKKEVLLTTPTIEESLESFLLTHIFPSSGSPSVDNNKQEDERKFRELLKVLHTQLIFTCDALLLFDQRDFQEMGMDALTANRLESEIRGISQNQNKKPGRKKKSSSGTLDEKVQNFQVRVDEHAAAFVPSHPKDTFQVRKMSQIFCTICEKNVKMNKAGDIFSLDRHVGKDVSTPTGHKHMQKFVEKYGGELPNLPPPKP